VDDNTRDPNGSSLFVQPVIENAHIYMSSYRKILSSGVSAVENNCPSLLKRLTPKGNPWTAVVELGGG
jgi:hypothetical protein